MSALSAANSQVFVYSSFRNFLVDRKKTADAWYGLEERILCGLC
jgi:hypothetical protein